MAFNFSSPSLCDLVPDLPYGDSIPEQMPKEWFVVFHETTPRPWLRWFALGKFKHVSCFGWVEWAQSYVFFDPALERTWLRLVPADVAEQELPEARRVRADCYFGGDVGRYCSLGTVVRIDTQVDDVMRPNIGIGRGCVRDVARLVGVRTRAIRPDAFFRDCLKRGGIVHSIRGRLQ